MSRTIPALFLLVLVAASVDAAGQLQRNPFRVPIELDAPVAAAGGPQMELRPDTLDLRATLVAGERSVVNLGGSILSLGEEIEGYRLVSVSEGEALFIKDGESIRVFVDEDDEPTDGPDER